jgi:hypothetical protein
MVNLSEKKLVVKDFSLVIKNKKLFRQHMAFGKQPNPGSKMGIEYFAQSHKGMTCNILIQDSILTFSGIFHE